MDVRFFNKTTFVNLTLKFNIYPNAFELEFVESNFQQTFPPSWPETNLKILQIRLSKVNVDVKQINKK